MQQKRGLESRLQRGQNLVHIVIEWALTREFLYLLSIIDDILVKKLSQENVTGMY